MSEITSSTAGNVNDNIQSMMNKTQEYIEYMNNAIYGKEGWQTAWKEYINGIGNIQQSSGQAYKDMMENAEEMGEMNGFSAAQSQAVLNALKNTLKPLTDLTAAWDSHNKVLTDTINKYETLARNIQNVLTAVGQIPNTVGTGGDNASGGSSSEGSSGESSAGNNTRAIDGKKYAKGGLIDYTGIAWVDGTPDDPERRRYTKYLSRSKCC